MNVTNNYLFKYITLQNSILFENQGVTIALLILSPLSVAYVLMVLLHTLTMNVLSSYYMPLMIIFGA
jgi:hypothetical protein